MKLGLLIAIGAAGLLGGAAWAWRHGRERRERRAWGLLPGWTARSDIDALRSQLVLTALSQVGHSRRILRAVTAPGETEVFEYACESGFEARRYLHQWLVAIQQTDHALSPAVFTTQSWLKPVASESFTRSLPLPTADSKQTSIFPRVAIVESTADWQPIIDGGLGAWLAAQPVERTWEVLPGFVAAHEPGRLEAYKAAALAEDVKTFIYMLATIGPAAAGSEPPNSRSAKAPA